MLLYENYKGKLIPPIILEAIKERKVRAAKAHHESHLMSWGRVGCWTISKMNFSTGTPWADSTTSTTFCTWPFSSTDRSEATHSLM